jgi:hypothetical protein
VPGRVLEDRVGPILHPRLRGQFGRAGRGQFGRTLPGQFGRTCAWSVWPNSPRSPLPNYAWSHSPVCDRTRNELGVPPSPASPSSRSPRAAGRPGARSRPSTAARRAAAERARRGFAVCWSRSGTPRATPHRRARSGARSGRSSDCATRVLRRSPPACALSASRTSSAPGSSSPYAAWFHGGNPPATRFVRTAPLPAISSSSSTSASIVSRIRSRIACSIESDPNSSPLNPVLLSLPMASSSGTRLTAGARCGSTRRMMTPFFLFHHESRHYPPSQPRLIMSDILDPNLRAGIVPPWPRSSSATSNGTIERRPGT